MCDDFIKISYGVLKLSYVVFGISKRYIFLIKRVYCLFAKYVYHIFYITLPLSCILNSFFFPPSSTSSIHATRPIQSLQKSNKIVTSMQLPNESHTTCSIVHAPFIDLTFLLLLLTSSSTCKNFGKLTMK